MKGEKFECHNCNGKTQYVDENNVYHNCGFRPSESYGMENVGRPYHRVKMVDGNGYQWFVTWS